MANDIQEIGYVSSSGKTTMVPSAASIRFTICGEPSCGGVHAFLLDQAGTPFAEATFNQDMCELMLKMLRDHL